MKIIAEIKDTVMQLLSPLQIYEIIGRNFWYRDICYSKIVVYDPFDDLKHGELIEEMIKASRKV